MERPATRVLGYQAAAMGIGVLILEASGGLLAGISWRAAFLIYLIGSCHSRRNSSNDEGARSPAEGKEMTVRIR